MASISSSRRAVSRASVGRPGRVEFTFPFNALDRPCDDRALAGLVFFFVAMLPFPPRRLRQNDGVCLASLQKTGKGGWSGRAAGPMKRPALVIAAAGDGGTGMTGKAMPKRPFRRWRITRFVIGR